MTEPVVSGGEAPQERRSPLYSKFMELTPSLDWALAKLAGVWAKEGEMIRCPLPGHEDSTPSFNMWDGDENGVPQRFGCFGCGRNGDVVDLIMELESLDEQHALERAGELAREEAGDDTPRERAPREKKPSRDLEKLIESFHRDMDEARLTKFIRVLDQKGLDGEDIQTYIMDEWGWVPGDDAPVAMPHRDREGIATGIKYRSSKTKWNEDGSVFPAMYGTWRDQGRPIVVLCEGESDTVWAAWSLRNREDIDVLGIPSGVQGKITEEWLAQLTDRELIIALDSDEEGVKAARRWIAARPDAMLARLPDGEDLLSCGIPVEEIVERAETPRRSSDMIKVVNGVFARTVKDGDVPVSDFAFAPVRELYTKEGPVWEVVMSGDRRTTLIRASDLHSGSSITKWANRHGGAWMGGSGPAAQGLYNWLKSRSAFLPLERAVTQAGKIGRSFVGPDFCIGPDRVRYIPPTLGDAKLNTKLKIQPGPWDEKSILALETLNDPGSMAVILGWLCATLLRGERAPAPPLFIAGESGAGKTNMLATTLRAFGFNTETNLTTTTPFGVDCVVSSCIGFPVWFDEYRGGAREDSMLRLRQLLRDAFYGQPSMKGGMTQQATELTEVTTWAGMVVSGEMGTQETSHRDRMVVLDLNPDAKNREAYQWLQKAERTYGLGYSLLEFLAKRPDVLFRITPHDDKELPERTRDTLGFVQAGWQAWLEFRWEKGIRTKAEPPNLAMLAQSRRQAEDPWLEAIKACEGVTDRSGTPIVEQHGDDLVVIPQEVVVEAKRVGIELPARANELVAWLKRRYEVSDTRVGGRRAKVVHGMKL